MKEKKNMSKSLNIIIVGCGKVGTTLTEQLDKEGHDITIIDKDVEKITAITNLHDVMGIVGNGASYSVQGEAGIKNADLLIAVTGSDELNLLCCTVAKQVADCSTIARVRTPDYISETAYLRDKLGLAMVLNPEYEMAREAARILYLPSTLEVGSFAHGQAELIKFKIPKDNLMDGLSLAELNKKTNTSMLICALERNGEVSIPTGNTVLESGDIVSCVCSRKKVRSFLSEIGFKTKQVKDTMIIGGGRTSYYLASQLINMGVSVKIIEQNRSRCDELSLLLPKATIINGDGTNEDLLKEEGIETVQSFVALTGIDEENILLTMYAGKISNAKVITKINRIRFKELISSLDLGSVIYPKYITSEAIIAYVRAKSDSLGRSSIETLYHMYDNRVEAIEFNVDENSPVTSSPIMDLDLKKGVLISFINRNGQIIIPSGSDRIMSGDTVMIVTTNTGFNDVSDILAGHVKK